ncbi:MAG TPA: 2-oxoacid:acceptor oxidoreductase family protein [Candidatus Nanopelagicaceae bacterium]|nr:2-oxoacid:acceptor oxidoreductase family protein [Candidatus Nanopelagicaceae bacterium]
MFQVRIHGRGGQGVVTAAELLSVAAFQDELFAQAFPSFGSERTGAPVVAFCRISKLQIRSREPVMEPDALIIQDSTLLQSVDVFAGAAPDAFILINSTKSFNELGLEEFFENRQSERSLIVPASEIALRHVGRPLPNAALLGAFAAITELVTLDSVLNAIEERFPAKIAEANADAAREAHEFVLAGRKVAEHASTN